MDDTKNGKVDKAVLSEMVNDLIGALGEKEVLEYPPLRCPRCGFLICCDPIIFDGKEH